MDPNANLEELRRLAESILELTVEEGERGAADLHAGAVRLAELALALDHWLSTGGFLPKAWERKP